MEGVDHRGGGERGTSGDAVIEDGYLLRQEPEDNGAGGYSSSSRKRRARDAVGRFGVRSFPWVILFFVLFVGFGVTFTYEAPAAVVSDLMTGMRMRNQDYAW